MGAFHVADLAQPVRLLGLRYFDGRLENSAERKIMTPEQGATPSMSCIECGVPWGVPHQSFCRRGDTSMPKFGYAEALTPVGAGDGDTFVVNTALYEREIKRLTAELTAALSRAEAAEAKVTQLEREAQGIRSGNARRELYISIAEKILSEPGYESSPMDSDYECDLHDLAWKNVRELQSAQERAARLELALDDAADYLEDCCQAPVTAEKFRATLAAAPSNWLRDRLREERAKERERCADLCDEIAIGYTVTDGIKDCALSIRAMPEGE